MLKVGDEVALRVELPHHDSRCDPHAGGPADQPQPKAESRLVDLAGGWRRSRLAEFPAEASQPLFAAGAFKRSHAHLVAVQSRGAILRVPMPAPEARSHGGKIAETSSCAMAAASRAAG